MVHRLDELHGFVDEALVVQEIGPHTDADFYICGPGPFMDIVEGALGGLGVPPDQIFIERFESPTEAPAEPEGETILAAARRTGLEPPFACEEAYCGCCMAKVVDGDVEMQMNDGGISQRQIDEGWVLTCQGIPKSAATVEYPD